LFEVGLCFAALDLGECPVAKCAQFRSFTAAGDGFLPAAAEITCAAAAAEAKRVGADVVLVLSEAAAAKTPGALTAKAVLAPLRAVDIAGAPGPVPLKSALTDLSPHSACVRMNCTVADAMGFLAQAAIPLGLALVRGTAGEVVGVLDGEAVFEGMLAARSNAS